MVIAGPNLTIDRTLAIDELRPGEVLRFERAAVTPGGKGVNVARVARDLGADAVLVGLLPGRTGVAGAALLGDEGIVVRGVEVGGELRSTAVVLERSGRVTVLNEPGPPLAPGEWELYEGVVADALRGERVLACSGSLPPGAPADAYARLVGLAHAAGALAIVDVGGEQLAAAVAAGADVVTPNLAEAEGLLHGRADETVDAGDVGVVRERAVAAARALVGRGAASAVVTAAEAGAAVADGWLARWIAAPAVAEVRNPIGAGDALVGGLAWRSSAARSSRPRSRSGWRAGPRAWRPTWRGSWSPSGSRRCWRRPDGCALAVLRSALNCIIEGKRTRGGAAVRGRPLRGSVARRVVDCGAPGHTIDQPMVDELFVLRQQSSTLAAGGRAQRADPPSLGDAVARAGAPTSGQAAASPPATPLTSLSSRG